MPHLLSARLQPKLWYHRIMFKIQTSMRLTKDAVRLRNDFLPNSVSLTDVIELAIRELANREGLK